ncbi:neurofilament heavy polypeptide-like [Anomalospiza imberbis]|uniref:neurofilament heavy polypeptide-like n=1 Tax=Anomalospiza imberbis TaxID=187417 RepID=UPI00358FA56F
MELRAPLRREAPGRAARPQHRCAGSGGRRRRRLPPRRTHPGAARAPLSAPPAASAGLVIDFQENSRRHRLPPSVSPSAAVAAAAAASPALARSAAGTGGPPDSAGGARQRGAAELHSPPPRACPGTRSGPLGSANSSRNRTTSNAAGSRNSSLVEVFSGCASLSVAKLSAGFALSPRVNKTPTESAHRRSRASDSCRCHKRCRSGAAVSGAAALRGAERGAHPARRSCLWAAQAGDARPAAPCRSRRRACSCNPKQRLRLIATVPSTLCSTAKRLYLGTYRSLVHIKMSPIVYGCSNAHKLIFYLYTQFTLTCRHGQLLGTLPCVSRRVGEQLRQSAALSALYGEAASEEVMREPTQGRGKSLRFNPSSEELRRPECPTAESPPKAFATAQILGR